MKAATARSGQLVRPGRHPTSGRSKRSETWYTASQAPPRNPERPCENRAFRFSRPRFGLATSALGILNDLGVSARSLKRPPTAPPDRSRIDRAERVFALDDGGNVRSFQVGGDPTYALILPAAMRATPMAAHPKALDDRRASSRPGPRFSGFPGADRYAAGQVEDAVAAEDRAGGDKAGGAGGRQSFL